MSIRKASAQTTVNRGTAAAAAATVNQITIAPATATSVAGGGSLGGGGVTISNVSIMSNAFANATVLSGDTAISTAGGFVRVTGTGFKSNAVVYFNNTAVSNTFVSSTQINATIPSSSASTYNFYIFNSDGSGSILANGLQTSGPPSWTTTSYSSAALALGNIQLLATGDAPLTFYIQPGSSNPQNLAVNSAGYLSGTVSGEGAYTITVVVDDAQSQSTQADITVTVSVGDPYFNLTTLQLAGEGTNNANNQSFIDSSSNNFTITRNGNATQGTFAPFSQTGWSNYFDGTSDSLLTPGNTSLVLDGDFTIEFFMYLNSLSISAPISSNQGSFASGAFAAIISHGTAANKLSIWAENINNAAFLIASNSTLSISQWYHVAIVRNSGVIRLYLNGVDEGNTSSSATITLNGGATPRFRIGQYWNGTINGYISNLRVVKGAAVYTAAFTPPTSPLTAIANTSLLTCQSNRFVDNSTNAFVMTPSGDASVQAFSPFAPTAAYSVAAVGGSGYFDGTGDFLTLGTSTNLALGAGDFTIDVWLYLTAYNGSLGVIFDWRTAGSTPTNIPLFSLSPSGVPAFWQSVSLGAAITGSSAVPLNTWAHLAVVRNGLGSNNLTMYLNGTSIGSATATNSLGIETLRLNDPQGSFGQAGYFSSARIVKGTAVYTANFTPPTAPLTAIANTQLLLNFTNAGITDATAKNVLETVGDAKISTAQSKFGGSSMLFDGTDDRLKIPYNPNLLLGSGNFTVEMWLYKLANTAYMVAAGNLSAPSSAAWTLISDVNGNLISWYTNGNFQMTSTTSLATSTWYHLAITRSGTTGRLFINGVQESTWTDSVNYNVTNDLFIGNDAQLISGRHWNGYIEDFRITRGFARYTANFTPPTETFRLR